jgi:hypothetical protein
VAEQRADLAEANKALQLKLPAALQRRLTVCNAELVEHIQ